MTGAHVDGDLFANLGPDSEQTDAHAVAKVDRRLVPSALVTEANYAVSEAADSSAAADETTVSLQSADASKQCSPPESFNASPCREQPQTAAPIRASLTPTRASLRTSQSGSKRSLKETVKRVSHMTRNSSSKVFPVRLAPPTAAQPGPRQARFPLRLSSPSDADSDVASPDSWSATPTGARETSMPLMLSNLRTRSQSMRQHFCTTILPSRGTSPSVRGRVEDR